MSFGQHTPESLLARSDSKNPATTCKGITTAGRPCRRALAAGNTDSPSSPHTDTYGVLAILDAGDAGAFFCWQHKEQADTLVTQLQNRSRILPLRRKSSIDTLMERVGVLDLDEVVEQDGLQFRRQERRVQGSGVASHTNRRRDTLPQQWQRIHGPLMSVPEDFVESEVQNQPAAVRPSSRPQKMPPNRERRPHSKASWSCCSSKDVEDDLPPVRTRRSQPRVNGTMRPASGRTLDHGDVLPVQSQPIQAPVRRKRVSEMHEIPQRSSPIIPKGLSKAPHSTPTRPPARPQNSHGSPPHSQTVEYLSLIPSHLSPATTSALLAELSRPISEADKEGYIYIFWLTPETDSSKPDDETASSLLDLDLSPWSSSTSRQRRQGEHRNHDQQVKDDRITRALTRYASVRRTSSERQKILLKIGRAANVHRRLSQWSRQCGQNITLIRFYPYQNRSNTIDANRMSTSTMQMVPNVARVERLIHLELADKRVSDKQECDACGRIHKEWFEVDASKEGLRQVDETVRRWVGWGQQQAQREQAQPRDDWIAY